MSKFSDWILEVFVGKSDDEYDDDDFYDDEEQAVSFPKNESKKSSFNSRTADSPFSEADSSQRDRTARQEKSPKLVSMQGGKRKGGMAVSIHQPKSIDESEDICDMLIRGNAVVVNLEGLNSIAAQRIMDFLCGCIYSMDGKYTQISKYIFMFSPNNVDVSSDLEFDTDGVPTFTREY